MNRALEYRKATSGPQYLRYLKRIAEKLPVSDEEIMQTREYQSYTNKNLVWGMDDHGRNFKKVESHEALAACRLMLNDMVNGKSINWKKEARNYVNTVRTILNKNYIADNHIDVIQPMPFLKKASYDELTVPHPKPISDNVVKLEAILNQVEIKTSVMAIKDEMRSTLGEIVSQKRHEAISKLKSKKIPKIGITDYSKLEEINPEFEKLMLEGFNAKLKLAKDRSNELHLIDKLASDLLGTTTWNTLRMNQPLYNSKKEFFELADKVHKQFMENAVWVDLTTRKSKTFVELNGQILTINLTFDFDMLNAGYATREFVKMFTKKNLGKKIFNPITTITSTQRLLVGSLVVSLIESGAKEIRINGLSRPRTYRTSHYIGEAADIQKIVFIDGSKSITQNLTSPAYTQTNQYRYFIKMLMGKRKYARFYEIYDPYKRFYRPDSKNFPLSTKNYLIKKHHNHLHVMFRE
ncbi:hypothetical protein [Ekhidna sp.]|uniref:hypothetical protein n=1 Tax=Ekhidna sp. TaxID=2608089 RepID=UPI00329A3F92